MSKYDLETVYPRYHVGSPKWLEIKQYHPEEPAGIIPFSVADMELLVAPEIIQGVKDYMDHTIPGYANATPEYKESVISWMKRRHDWEIEADWLVYTHGVIHAFYTAVKTYSDKGDGVILMTPVYYPMYTAVTANERTIVENKLVNQGNRYAIDFDDLEAKAKDPKNKMIIFCNPHNPGGMVWTKAELQKVADICIRNQVMIVSDEIHFDLISSGYSHTVLASLSAEIADHTVTFTAPSKTFNLAGMMASNAVIANKILRDKFLAELKTNVANPKCNVLGFEACRVAYEKGEPWLLEVQELIGENHRLVKEFLAKEFPEIVVMDMEGTYLLWMDFRALGIESKFLGEVLKKEAYLFLDDGYLFGELGEGFERWNLACPTRYVKEGLIRLKDVLDKYKKQKVTERC